MTILNPSCGITWNEYTFINSPFGFTGVIYGYEGSTAQEYANNFGRRFKAISDPAQRALGDVNGDGVVNAEDANEVLIAAAKYGTSGKTGLSEEDAAAADIDDNSLINANDANAILRYATAVGTGGKEKITDFV